MTYVTPEPKKILTVFGNYSWRFYPYPEESRCPKDISAIARAAPAFGFVVLRQRALYGNNQNGKFIPAKGQAEG